MKIKLITLVIGCIFIISIEAGCGSKQMQIGKTKKEILLLAQPGEIKGKILFECGHLPGHEICVYEDGKVVKWFQNAGGAKWVAGGKVLFFQLSHPNPQKRQEYKMDYKVIDFTTKTSQYEISHRPELVVEHVLSKDNLVIGWVAEREPHTYIDTIHLVLYDRSSGQIKKLTNYSKGGVLFSISISSDETKILYGYSDPLSPPEKIQIIDLDGNIQETVPVNGSSPKWSPDGKKMVFMKIYNERGNKENQRSTEIALYDFQTKQITRLTHYHGFLTAPCFSPDGKQVAFVVWDLGGHAKNIGVVNIDGTGFKRLLSKEYAGVGVDSPDWGP